MVKELKQTFEVRLGELGFTQHEKQGLSLLLLSLTS